MTTTMETPQATATSPPHRSDRELLDAMVASRVEQNRAHAARLTAMHAFHARRVAERKGGQGGRPRRPSDLTALRETQAEVAPLTGTSEHTVQIDLDNTERLIRWLPRLWARCVAGRIDLGKALACLDQMAYLGSDADRTAYARAIQDWFDKHDPPPDQRTPRGPLCTLSRDRIQRAARHLRLKHPRPEPSETFAEAFRRRRVSLRADEESGMACLSAVLAAHDAITADHRLTLIAKKRAQAPDETRTLAQLRADSLLDLIHGRLAVPATTGDLEHHEPCDRTCRVNGSEVDPDREDPDAPDRGDETCPLHPLVLTGDNGGPLGGYARPVVNVTVPITTLCGLDDSPGLLSGGTAIPADYARHIASDPGSTWYRLLTDEAGHFLALSTQTYQPSDPIWRSVTARDHTCVWPGCRRPSVAAHLDHRVPYPDGATSVENLQPLCQRHHQVKHADGYSVARRQDGSYAWTTRFGSLFITPSSTQPTPARTEPMPDQHRIDEEFEEMVSPLEQAFAELVLSR